MQNGFFRIACAAPAVKVADTVANTDNILSLAALAHSKGADVVLFPEMSVTGYTCACLLYTSPSPRDS